MPGGTHAPHHPTPEWIKKISDMHLFDKGWNKLRETDLRQPEEARRDPAGREADPWPKDLLKEWDQLTADEKKMFIRQVDVYAAYVAYTDHEIGRVIQAVEDMGKLDNTLIIYINGDNGTSAEGTLNGTPNEVAMFNGVNLPVEDQLKYFYDVWGSDKTYNHMAVPLGVGLRHAVLVDQADRLALRRHAAGHGDLLAEGDQGQGRHPQPVPPRDRHRADDPRSDAASRQPEVVDGIKQSPIEGVSMVYTFDKKNANAPSTHKTQYFEMMGDRAIYHDGWIAEHQGHARRRGCTSPPKVSVARLPVGAVRPDQGLDAVRGRRRQEPGKAEGDAGAVLEEAEKYQVLPLDASVVARLDHAAARASPPAATCSPGRGR